MGHGVPRPQVPRGAEKAGPSPAAQPPRGVEEPVKRGADAGRARPQVKQALRLWKFTWDPKNFG